MIGSEFYSDGITLSGGETQKLALARIFYAKKANLVLDEPSSALDPVSEHAFFEIFEREMKNNTNIIISHRLSSIQNADKIFMISSGQIIEQGTHTQLMQQGGEYAKLYLVQASKFKLPT
jgi:ATP-binding cassette subfamily B protein